MLIAIVTCSNNRTPATQSSGQNHVDTQISTAIVDSEGISELKFSVDQDFANEGSLFVSKSNRVQCSSIGDSLAVVVGSLPFTVEASEAIHSDLIVPDVCDSWDGTFNAVAIDPNRLDFSELSDQLSDAGWKMLRADQIIRN